jgi:O-antigen/teichoic acid export membrane protein
MAVSVMEIGRRLGSGRRDFLGALVARGLSAPLAFGANILLARLLGPGGFGSYLTLLSAALVAAGIATYGVAPVLTREISACPDDVRPAMVHIARAWAVKLTSVLLAVSVATLCLWLTVGPGAPQNSIAERLATIAIIPVSVGIAVVSGMLSGLSQVAKSTSIGNLWKNGFLLVGAGILLIGRQAEVVDALWLQCISIGIAAALGYFWIGRTLRAMPVAGVELEPFRDSARARSRRRDWTKAAGHFFAMSAALLFMGKLDVIVVNALAGPREAGLFGAAMRVCQVANIAGLVWIAWIQPRVSAHYKSERYGALRKTLRRGLVGGVGMTAASVLVAWLLASWLMELMGPGYREATVPFRWLLVGVLTWSASIPSYALLSMTGGESVLSRILWAQLIVTLLAAVPLAHSYGALGGSWAWAMGMCVGSVATIVAAISRSSASDWKPRKVESPREGAVNRRGE